MVERTLLREHEVVTRTMIPLEVIAILTARLGAFRLAVAFVPAGSRMTVPSELFVSDSAVETATTPSSIRQSRLLLDDPKALTTVNEAIGHHMGNQVLNTAAQRIRAQAGQRALLARLGGDQFCVAIDDPNAADTLAQQVLDALARPFTGGDREVHLSASIGVAAYPEDGDDAATLVSHAEAAMYRAKESGRNRIARE